MAGRSHIDLTWADRADCCHTVAQRLLCFAKLLPGMDKLPTVIIQALVLFSQMSFYSALLCLEEEWDQRQPSKTDTRDSQWNTFSVKTTSGTMIHTEKHLNHLEVPLQSITRQFLPVVAFGPSTSQCDSERWLHSPPAPKRRPWYFSKLTFSRTRSRSVVIPTQGALCRIFPVLSYGSLAHREAEMGRIAIYLEIIVTGANVTLHLSAKIGFAFL